MSEARSVQLADDWGHRARLGLITLLFTLFAWSTAAVGAESGVARPGSELSGGFCSPPALGSPCASGGLATVGNPEPIPGLAIGNPVHLASGNKYQLDVDLPANPAMLGLELVRHYNSLSTKAGPLGRNWTLSYDTQLFKRMGRWRVRQADGSVLDHVQITAEETAYVWQLPNGSRMNFDVSGRFESISTGRSTVLRIVRHLPSHPFAGHIHEVRGRSGHSLIFHYRSEDGEVLLDSVDTPTGKFQYVYGRPPASSSHRSARLEAVIRPDGMQRVYHYEPALQAGNPFALTGISLGKVGSDLQRLASWTYDAYGRVVTLRQHGRALPDLHLDYVQSPHAGRKGVTRVRSGNGLHGEITYQRMRGNYQLVSRRLNVPGFGVEAIQYDAAGRLLAVGNTRIKRATEGELIQVDPHAPGWPGLSLRLEPPHAYSWLSRVTGRSTLLADSAGRPAALHYANGDRLLLDYDRQSRPVRLDQISAASGETHTTRLQWRGHRLQRIVHPFETESREYDGHGRLIRRRVVRPALLDAPAFQFQEGFEYDAQGRVVHHRLPEGGALHFQWQNDGGSKSLTALYWEDAAGTRHRVISSDGGKPGYRFGNGLQLTSAAVEDSHADTLAVSDGPHLVWLQIRHHDAQGRILNDTHEYPRVGLREELQFSHDAVSRMSGAVHVKATQDAHWWYGWSPDGSLAALRKDGNTLLPRIERDESGLPSSLAAHTLRYGPERRLQAVIHDSGWEAQYRHNAFGHRIVKRVRPSGTESKGATSTTHFLYLHDRMVAEARTRGGEGPVVIHRRYLYAGLTPVGMIDYSDESKPRLYAVHSDLNGAPRMLTDGERNIRWLAGYSPTGQATRLAGDLHFPLRFPGQYEDVETGWHDNLLRTYLPQFGQYLEPDPLGPLPHNDAYGYAQQRPWQRVDPQGLLLFAFDGTRYSSDSMSNVWLFAQAYRDGPAHYHSGPGNSLFLDWDAVVAWRAGQILENQWQALLTSLERPATGAVIPIDIIGFSRGASLARHFGNRIASHINNGLFSVDDPLRGRISACVDLRFMGLFDTVAQFGIAGSHNHLYDFAISEMWSWVAHAVALHEHRWTFPLTSADAGDAGNVVEAPLVGAHADIGGGLALLSPAAPPGPATEEDASAGRTDTQENESDLAKVALAWMHWQAQAAGLSLDDMSGTVEAPFLRDMRSPLMRSVQQGDRAILAPSGRQRFSYQDSDRRLGRRTREEVERFISRAADWRRAQGERVGTVDMAGYSQWLEDTLGWTPQLGAFPAD